MASRRFQVGVSGANICVAAKPLRSVSRKRTKEIATVRHPYLDFDIDGEARLTSLRVSEAIPTLTAFISRSPGKYQILWRVDAFTLGQQESTLELFAIAFGRDPACTVKNAVEHPTKRFASAVRPEGSVRVAGALRLHPVLL